MFGILHKQGKNTNPAHFNLRESTRMSKILELSEVQKGNTFKHVGTLFMKIGNSGEKIYKKKQMGCDSPYQEVDSVVVWGRCNVFELGDFTYFGGKTLVAV